MKRVLIAVAGLLAALVVSTPVAHAAPTGTVLVVPGQGADVASIRLRTSAGCPQQSKAYYARLWGKGFPEAGQVITTNTAAGMRHDGGFDVYLAQTMKDFAALAGGVTLSGTYKISVYCIDRFPSQVHAEFTGSLEFTTPTAYRALGASMPKGDAPPPLNPPAPLELGENAPPPTGAPAQGQPGQQGEQPQAVNAVPAESNTNLILLVVGALLVGPAIWLVLRLLRRRPQLKGTHE